MTDDRAERIRKTRNRFRPNGGDGDTEGTNEASESDGAESTDDTGPNDASSGVDEGTGDDTGDETDYPSLDDLTDDEGDETDYPSLDDLTDDGETSDGTATRDADDGSTEDTEVSYDETDAIDSTTSTAESDLEEPSEGMASATDETPNVPEIDATTDGEPTVDASAIATEDDTYDQAVTGDERDSFVDNDALARSAHRDEDTIQVLEFFLNDDRYAVEIERISAIVEMKDIARFPRGPEAIDGVTDLRGEITAILDPTAMLDVERSEASEEHYIVVLKRSDDKQKLGIRVTDVSQAVTYHESQIDETGSAMSDGGVTDSGNVGETGGVSERSGEHTFVRGIIKKTENDKTSLVAWLDVDEVVGQIE